MGERIRPCRIWTPPDGRIWQSFDVRNAYSRLGVPRIEIEVADGRHSTTVVMSRRVAWGAVRDLLRALLGMQMPKEDR